MKNINKNELFLGNTLTLNKGEWDKETGEWSNSEIVFVNTLFEVDEILEKNLNQFSSAVLRTKNTFIVFEGTRGIPFKSFPKQM